MEKVHRGVITIILLVMFCLPAHAFLYGENGPIARINGDEPITNYKHDSKSRLIERDGKFWVVLTFEGVGDFNQVNTIPGVVDVTFGPSWIGNVDYDAGGSAGGGNFANEPSPDTVVGGSGCGAPSCGDNDPIIFSEGVNYVSLYYSAGPNSLPFVVKAYGEFNQLLAQAVGHTIGTAADGAPCGGDPTGNWCLWEQREVIVPASSDLIFSIVIESEMMYYSIDSMELSLGEVDLLPSMSLYGILMILLGIGLLMTFYPTMKS